MVLNKWKLYHTYNLLVIRRDAAAILCPDCFEIVVSIIDAKIDEPTPALYCLACDSVIRPGLDFWDQLEQVVLEHYKREDLL